MKFFKSFYDSLGNTKEQKFKRFWLLVITGGIFTMLIVNVGYEKEKGGFYFKPLDISIKKGE
jgi:hypothetical protein